MLLVNNIRIKQIKTHNYRVKSGIYSAEGHRLNRRAEVFTTDNLASEYFPVDTVAPATTETAPTYGE